MAKREQSPRTLSFKPQGSRSGRDWDDGAAYSTIKSLKIYYGGKCIDAIQFEYEDKDGNSICPEKHGGNEGTETIHIHLNSCGNDNEYLISVHGYHGNIYDPLGNPTNVIRSLTFETNQRSLGPFGIEDGTKFSFPTSGFIKIVGFHGTSGWYLDSIGFHFIPISI